MEPWQRVWIDAETYKQDIHSYINCTTCHKGQAVEDMAAAHTGMNPRPAADPATCGTCHTDITTPSMNSLHTTLRGYDTVLQGRSVPENHPLIETIEQNHCNSCHTTCGDCHISQPENVGGGLLKAHTFVETPPMSQTCTGCHGSRVKNEYYGLNEELPSDVHFRARMSCSDCHTGEQIHGTDPSAAAANHRYDGTRFPTCENCHQAQIGVGSGIEQHEVHGTELLSCQTCHSVAYTNCVNCHVAQTEDKTSYFKVEDHFLAFYIGLNPIRNAERPYRYAPVRHVPIDRNSFSFYGENLLPNFDSRETWTYSTPHNIQRNTPQTASCESCHTNAALFLTADKVAPEERAANKGVIVEKIPTLPPDYKPGAAATPTAESSGGSDDFWGGGGSAPTATPSAGGDDFWGGGGGGSEATPLPTATPGDFWGGN